MSEPFTMGDVASWTGARLLGDAPDTVLHGVCTDSRAVLPGVLFVAIRGPRHDAHSFLDAALAGGAAALLLERAEAVPAGSAVPVAVVADTTAGLGALAAGHRRRFHGPVIAITGSNGKTTTKEMLAAILSVAGPCLKNRGNLNNQFGLPLTLLEREAEHRALVVEIGMNHRGEIAPLAAIAAPTVGVITNVGSAHLEHLGSLEQIALEKGDLVAALPDDGVAVLNADDSRVAAQAARTRARVLTFGRGEAAELRAEAVQALPEGGFGFELVWERGRHEVQVAGLGEPTVINALAAAAAAIAAGTCLPDVVRGLAAYRGVQRRMARVELGGGRVLIDDSYNANPQSTEAALRSLARWSEGGRALAVLGSMGELGDSADEAHRRMGRLAAELGVARLFSYGERAELLAAGAAEGGLASDHVMVGRSHEELTEAVASVLQEGDWVLVKGSRAMQMERVVEGLTRDAKRMQARLRGPKLRSLRPSDSEV